MTHNNVRNLLWGMGLFLCVTQIVRGTIDSDLFAIGGALIIGGMVLYASEQGEM